SGNLALSKSVQTKTHVRVIRGYKLKSKFAPKIGYRYDGLYRVEQAWKEVGLSGFVVWKVSTRQF
ncbi:SRA-YDG protein, partial [Gonapodya prolifera JEL478]